MPFQVFAALLSFIFTSRALPFVVGMAVGGMLAGVMAPPDRTMHALVAVDLAIVLWLLGVF